MSRQLRAWMILIALYLVPVLANAHTDGVSSIGFLAGVLHPMSGLDHAAAMVAVGLWGSRAARLVSWRFVLALIGGMGFGVVLAVSSISLPGVEVGIMTLLLILGLFVASDVGRSAWIASAIVALFGVFHGHLHGAEFAETTFAWWYAVGFALVSMFLITLGGLLGKSLRKYEWTWLVRGTGAGLAAASALMLVIAL